MKRSEIKTAIGYAINNCSNNISVDELIKLQEFETTIETCNLSELLDEKRKEVADLEKTIEEIAQAKAKADAEAKEKAKVEAEKQEKFISSLSNSEKETLTYLEGVLTLAKDEDKKLVNMLLDIYANCSVNTELVLTARLASYVTVLVIENQKDTVNLLETITLKIDNIQCNVKAGTVNARLSRFERILLSVQDLY